MVGAMIMFAIFIVLGLIAYFIWGDESRKEDDKPNSDINKATPSKAINNRQIIQ
jgi:heme/copper-type cytochrome/quinol oxidase subunit 2